MLKERLITAAVLIPIGVGTILFLPHSYFTLFILLLAAYATWEWSNLSDITETWQKLVYILVLVVCLLLVGLFFDLALICTFGFIFWPIAGFLLWHYQRNPEFLASAKIGKAVMGMWVIIPCAIAVTGLRQQVNGQYWLIYALTLVCLADAAAYFAGKKWGKHKLMPTVSPGKTWEGFYGAMLTGLILALLDLLILPNTATHSVSFVILSLLVVLISVIGDLFISLLKRQIGLKDTGSILPGHGGLLDRVDSILSGLPLFTLGYLLIGFAQ